MEAATMLVVDDDHQLLKTISAGLQSAGFVTFEARDTEQGGRLAREHTPALTLLGLDGAEHDALGMADVLSEARLPFIVLSASNDAEQVEQAVQAGALAYLVKPIAIDHLIPLLRSSLGCAEEIRRLRESTAQLDRALAQGREISIVVGILMERCDLSASQAFDALRDDARSQRKKMADLAAELLAAADTLHATARRLAGRADAKEQRHKRPPKRFPARVV